MPNSRGIWPVLFLGLLCGLAAPLRAAENDLEMRVREQLRSTTVALREAQDQNAALTAKQAELTQQLATANQQLDELRKKPAGPTVDEQNRLATAEAAAKQSETAVTEARALIDKWQAAYNQAADVARSRDAAAKELDIKLKQSAAGLGQCVAKNDALVKISGEILDKLDHHDFLEDIERDEPVTQIYRVKLQNIAQDYQDKVRDQEIQK